MLVLRDYHWRCVTEQCDGVEVVHHDTTSPSNKTHVTGHNNFETAYFFIVLASTASMNDVLGRYAWQLLIPQVRRGLRLHEKQVTQDKDFEGWHVTGRFPEY